MATLSEINPRVNVDPAAVQPERAPTSPSRWKNLLAIASRWSTALVLAALAVVAYWGYRTGWKLPKFSALLSGAQSKQKDWCDEHNVPESMCVECNEKVFPKP